MSCFLYILPMSVLRCISIHVSVTKFLNTQDGASPDQCSICCISLRTWSQVLKKGSNSPCKQLRSHRSIYNSLLQDQTLIVTDLKHNFFFYSKENEPPGVSRHHPKERQYASSFQLKKKC